MAKKTTRKSVPSARKLSLKKAIKPKSAKTTVSAKSKLQKPPKAAKRLAPVVETKPVAPAKLLRPGKNLAGLKTKDLQHYRDLLLAKRRELLGDVDSMEDEALRNSGGTNLSNLPIHMADMGTDNYEQEFTLGLVEKDRNLLREIHIALAKLQDGSYGICEGTGKPIAKPRLEAQPWTRYSIEHARKLEQNRLRRS